MTTTHHFTDATGSVVLDGQPVPELRVIGWSHNHPCPQYQIATIEIGRMQCDCGGRALIGWADQWPLADVGDPMPAGEVA